MCKTSCKLCKRLVLSQSITVLTAGSVAVNIPAGNYANGEKYCIVLAQTIPTTATISAPVVVTIGDGSTQYPLLRCDGTPCTACSLRTRTRYSTRVSTSTSGGSFVLMGKVCCAPSSSPDYINGG